MTRSETILTVLSRRRVIGALGAGMTAGLASTLVEAQTGPGPTSTASLTPLTQGAVPIGAEERRARLAEVQRRLAAAGLAALIIEPGSALEYFTGVQWRRSERTTAAIIPARGQTVVVTPAFEEPSVRETLQVDAEVRSWNEQESPFLRIAQALDDRAAGGGRLAVEATTRFFIIEEVRRLRPGLAAVSADGVINPMRRIKSAHEIALMQTANDVTLAALRHVHGRVQDGMSAQDIAALMDRATVALGGAPEFSLVLLNEASAYPHGSKSPQAVREGSVILMDCGCTVHGYQSDISRTWVHGAPTPRQRSVWATVRRGQEVALETARVGLPAGQVDDAVRRYYDALGWGPGYRLPGLPHRTGHGIGLDGHEPPYLVHGDETPLEAGMCFSDEPGLYSPQEFGVRLEDCWRMTADGPRTFTPLARSLDDPI